MKVKRRFSRKYWILISLLAVVVIGGVVFALWPETFQYGERQNMLEKIGPYDVAIIFNPGGWGNATLAEAKDFAPILENIQQNLALMGYTSIIVPYARTPAGFSGTITGIKEYLNSFRGAAEIQTKDMEILTAAYPEKRFILAGFSNGGGMTDRVMADINNPRVCSIVAGVPGWYPTHNTNTSLALNNNGQDPLACKNYKSIAINVIKAPYRWIHGKITGEHITLGTAFHFPGHEYTWDSPEVGPVIKEFLERNLP